jgi:hypothetical protein
MLVAGRRFGKSVLLRAKTIAAATNFVGKYDPSFPPVVLIATPFLKQGRTIHWDALVNVLQNDPRVKRIFKSDFRIVFHGKKPDIILAGANDSNGDNLRGMKLVAANLDEYQDFNDSIWDYVIYPALSDTDNSQGLIIGTPKGKINILYKLYCHAKSDPANWATFHQVTADNPYFKKSELEIARGMLPPKAFRQEYEASWEDFDGQIFTCFDYQRNTIDPDDLASMYPFDEVFLGADWGDINPAFVVIGRRHNIYYLLDTWTNPEAARGYPVEQAVQTEALANLVYSYGIQTGYADPSRPERIMSTRKSSIMRKFMSGNNRISEGNSIINTLFYQGRFVINRKLKATIDRFTSYHRKIKDGVVYDEPADGQDDHECLVAETLVTTSQGQIPISEVRQGDIVLTREGWKPVESAGKTGVNRRTMEVTFSNGATLRGTPTHKIWVVGKGWTRIDKLEAFDYLLTSYNSTCVVLTTKEAPRADVYNMTVQDCHEYFGNGVLVKNCDSTRYVLATLEKDIEKTLPTGKAQPVIWTPSGKKVYDPTQLPWANG